MLDSHGSNDRSSASLGRARTPSRKHTPDVLVQDVYFLESAAELDRLNEALSAIRSTGDRQKWMKKNQG